VFLSLCRELGRSNFLEDIVGLIYLVPAACRCFDSPLFVSHCGYIVQMLMKDPKVTTDSNLIAPLLPIKSQVTECISLSLDLPPNNVAVPSISPLTSLSEAKDTTPAASNIEQLITNNVSTLKL